MAKSNKVAIVTGSATGLGASCALDLAERGDHSDGRVVGSPEIGGTGRKALSVVGPGLLDEPDVGAQLRVGRLQQIGVDVDKEAGGQAGRAVEQRDALTKQAATREATLAPAPKKSELPQTKSNIVQPNRPSAPPQPVGPATVKAAVGASTPASSAAPIRTRFPEKSSLATA